jgi:hypothetical protein
MSPEAFAKLVDLLRPMLEVDPIRLGSHEPILPEIVVAIGSIPWRVQLQRVRQNIRSIDVISLEID